MKGPSEIKKPSDMNDMTQSNQILGQILVQIRKNSDQGLSSLVVFDLDSTLFNVALPLPTLKVRIDGGDVGPILFQGASASLGTLDANGRIIDHGAWIAAGDAGEWRGDQLHVLGRHDQVIKVGGERLSLMDIERALVAAGAREAAAWQSAGQVIAAIAAAAPLERKNLTAAFRAHLPRNAWPAVVYGVTDWPLLATGKTDCRRLQELARAGDLDVVFSL